MEEAVSEIFSPVGMGLAVTGSPTKPIVPRRALPVLGKGGLVRSHSQLCLWGVDPALPLQPPLAAPVSAVAMASGPTRSAEAMWSTAAAASLECAASMAGRAGTRAAPLTTRMPWGRAPARVPPPRKPVHREGCPPATSSSQLWLPRAISLACSQPHSHPAGPAFVPPVLDLATHLCHPEPGQVWMTKPGEIRPCTRLGFASLAVVPEPCHQLPVFDPLHSLWLSH